MTRVEGDISYRVRRSDRARRVRVRVDEQLGVEVVLPRRSAEREAAAAIRQLRPWIERRIAELERTRAAVAARGATVPYLGETLALIAEPGRTRVHRSGERLLVPGSPDALGAPESPDSPADAPLTRDALERWYRRRAHAEIAPRLDAATAQAGTSYTKLTIRGQRTRWASCSSNGGMSFNWRLLLAPAPVLDYVVWHEVCHLEVMDHSPRFWNLLASRWPDYKAHQTWLRHHGATLVL